MPRGGVNRNTSTSASSDLGELFAKSADLLKKDNTKLHKTEQYDQDKTSNDRLVVRRGQPFTLQLTFSRDIDFPNDKLEFSLRTGGAPRTNHGSLIYLQQILPESGDQDVAGIQYSSIKTGKTLNVKIFTTSSMGVGLWNLFVRARRSRKTYQMAAVAKVVVLFNPFNKVDQTYMKDPKWRDEYLINDEGLLYYGTARRIGNMDWYFGQYDSAVLDATLKLLSMDQLRYYERGNPVSVSRHMSGMVNANDDNGVLVGNWSGDYDDGISPTEWNSSYDILEKYLKSGAPVQYGQCWVFSGVLCAVLRCLGIPCRSVTNFESAHDTDANLTIDYEYDDKGKPIDTDDSIWNFHVWNDCWMARPDLPEGFGGWQALDATPQEMSEGKMQCGPMSLNAIKQGYINHPHDGNFIYAEVNATKRYWRKKKNGDWNEIHSDTRTVGQNISTKAVGSYARDDVTLQYKYAEGTEEEKLSFKVARSFAKHKYVDRKAPQDNSVLFNVEIPDNVDFGDDIPVTFDFNNVSKKSQNIFVSVVAKVMQYNGSVVAKIFDKDLNKTVAVDKTEKLKTSLPAKDWVGKVKGNDGIKFFILGEVAGTEQIIAYQDSVFINLPKVTVTASKTNVKVGESVTLNINFKNPLASAIKNGKLQYIGVGANGEFTIPKINAKENFTYKVTVVPKRIGSRKVIIGFSSGQLSGLQGHVILNVN